MATTRFLAITTFAILAAGLEAHAQVPEVPALLETKVHASGRPIGLAPAGDGSTYILVESPEDHAPTTARPHLVKVDRAGTVSPAIEIPRLSCAGDNEPLTYGGGYGRFRAPLSVLPSGEMLAVAGGGTCGVVGRFDAGGKLLQATPLRWGRPLEFRGDVRVIETSPDGSFVIAGEVVAAEHDAWIVKIDAQGAVAWSRSLGVGELLAYRSAPDGSGEALYGESSSYGRRYTLSRVELKPKGAAERRVRLMQCAGCRNTIATLLGSTAIYAPSKPQGLATAAIETYDRAGKRTSTRPWQLGGEIQSLQTADEGMVALTTVADPLDTDSRVLAGLDATGRAKWRTPAMNIVDVAVANGDIVVLVTGKDPTVDDWRILRYRP